MAHLRSDGAVVLSEAPKSPQWFAICANMRSSDLLPGEHAVVGASFNTGTRVMMISPTSSTDIGRGAIFAHELSHAYDALVNGEPDSAPMSDDWLFGELNAHAATMMILNEYSNGEYLKALKSADSARSALKRSMKKSVNSFAFGFDQSDSLRLTRALGPLNRNDLDMLNVQYQVDINIAPIKRACSGRDSTEFFGRALDMMHQLYSRSAPSEIVQHS